MPPKKSTAAAPIPVKPDALKGKSVIVTGEIEGYSRKAAEEILVNAGAKIEKSLNKKVQLVVLGADAGPKASVPGARWTSLQRASSIFCTSESPSLSFILFKTKLTLCPQF